MMVAPELLSSGQSRPLLSLALALAMTFGFCSVLLMDENAPSLDISTPQPRRVEHLPFVPPKQVSPSSASSKSTSTASSSPLPKAPSVATIGASAIPLPALSVNHELHWDTYMDMSRDVGFELEQTSGMEGLFSGEFSFEQLDQDPQFLGHHRPYEFPKDLIRKGIREGVVRVEVEIDTQGRVKRVKVLESSHPRLNAVALRLMRLGSFTVPTRGGKAVEVKDTWRLVLKSPK